MTDWLGRSSSLHHHRSWHVPQCTCRALLYSSRVRPGETLMKPPLKRCSTGALHLLLCTPFPPQELRVQSMFLPEAPQVHNKQSRDVVRLAPQVLLPETLLPEPEALHVLVVVAEGSEPKGSALQPRSACRGQHKHAGVSTCMLLEVSGRATRLLSRSRQHNEVSNRRNAATIGAVHSPQRANAVHRQVAAQHLQNFAHHWVLSMRPPTTKCTSSELHVPQP